MKKNYSFQSNLDNLYLVDQIVEEVASDFKIAEDLFGNVLLSLHEAVKNAIIHGNELKKTKKVYIEIDKSKNYLLFLIKDEGVGFDFENLPDPTLAENIENPTGRGIFLIKNLSDGIRFLNGGRELEIQFRV